MPLTGNIALEISFSVASDKRSGTITITDTTPYVSTYSIPLAAVIGKLTITAPDGMVIHGGSFAPPDIDHAVSTSYSQALPTDINGFVQTGLYVVNGVIRVNQSPDVGNNGDYTAHANHDLCLDFPTLELLPDVDCLCGVISARDTTNYNGWSLAVREMTYHYPAAVLSPVVSAGPTLTTAPRDIYTGNGYLTLAVTVTKDQVTVDLEIKVPITADCDFDLCSVQCCFQAAYNRWSRAVMGKYAIEIGREESAIQEMVMLINLIKGAQECGVTTRLNEWKSRFKLLGNCEDGCGCGDGDEPKRIVPICGPSGCDPVTIVAGPGMVVSFAAGVYTVSLSPANIQRLANTFNTSVGNSDGTITVDPFTVIGNPDERFYTLSTPPNRLENSLEMRIQMVMTGTGPAFTIQYDRLVGNLFQKITNLDITADDVAANQPTAWRTLPAVFKIDNFMTVLNRQGWSAVVSMIDIDYNPTPANRNTTIEPVDLKQISFKAKSAGPVHEFKGKFVIDEVPTIPGVPIIWDRFLLYSKAVLINIKIRELRNVP